MKYLQNFKLFESSQSDSLTKEQQLFLKKFAFGVLSVNQTTGLVDIEGGLDCCDKKLQSLSGLKFGTVTRSFDCEKNNLTSLKGAPKEVGWTFRCHENKLTSLEGSPQKVGRDFICYENQLTNLVGAPPKVEADFLCSDNLLTTLEGAPETVGEDFICNGNQLTTLAGAPQTVGKNFWCFRNPLISLEGAPQTVEGEFWCSAFRLRSGRWNLEGWLEVLQTGSLEAQKLILTLPKLNADYWNSEISSNPLGTLLILASSWDGLPEDIKGGIKIPSGLQDDFDNFLDLERAGVY
jgi:hypothetical protein